MGRGETADLSAQAHDPRQPSWLLDGRCGPPAADHEAADHERESNRRQGADERSAPCDRHIHRRQQDDQAHSHHGEHRSGVHEILEGQGGD
jgi:hypothetical protein